MQRIRQYEIGGPDVLRMEQAHDLPVEAGQIRIAVEVAGVHLVDTTMRAGGWGELDLPLTPGREVAGRVDQVGPGVDGDWLGRRVVAHLGMAGGGYADQAVTEVGRAHAVPEVLTFDTAVAAIGTGRTATGILDQVTIGPDDRVVVTSASGGLGALLVRAARSAGAEVAALANGPAKAEVVRRLGADHVVDVTAADWPDELRAAIGHPTLVFDGTTPEVGQVLSGLLDAAGTHVNYTGASADDFDGPARFQTVLGSALTERPGGLRSLEEEALAVAADGTRVPLVGSTFALAEAAAAHRALEERATYGKVVLVTKASP